MRYNPRTTVGIFMFAIVFFVGFAYFNAKSAVYKKEPIDLSYADMDNLKANMHVKMDVDKCLGYYLSSKESSGNSDKTRNYLVLRFNKRIRKYDSAIGIQIDSKDFEKWDKLAEDTKNDDNNAQHIYVDGITVAMDLQHDSIFLSALSKAKVPTNFATYYYIVLIDKKKMNYYKFTTLGAGIFCIICGLLYQFWFWLPSNRERFH